MALDEDTVRLAKGKNLATVVTLMPDGQPQALPTWVDTDGEYLLVNTEPTRQRAKNLARDPRITAHPGQRRPVGLVRGPRACGGNRGWPGSAPAHRRALPQVRGYRVQRSDGPGGRIILKIVPAKTNTAKSRR